MSGISSSPDPLDGREMEELIDLESKCKKISAGIAAWKFGRNYVEGEGKDFYSSGVLYTIRDFECDGVRWFIEHSNICFFELAVSTKTIAHEIAELENELKALRKRQEDLTARAEKNGQKW